MGIEPTVPPLSRSTIGFEDRAQHQSRKHFRRGFYVLVLWRAMRRRDALKTLGALAGAAGAGRFLPGCGDGGVAPPKGIETWVFLMMENRSYDHFLGARTMLEGKPGDGLTAAMSNRNSAGDEMFPWEATEETACVPDPPHGWSSSRLQLGGGACDGFAVAYQDSHPGSDGAAPMQYQSRRRVPVSWALADAYTTCDRWFCSVLGPTLPNRMYWHGGTANGARSNDEVLQGAFENVASVYHRLNDVGVPWGYYFGDVPVLGFLEESVTEGKIHRFLWDFIDDAAAGKLPPVVYIDPQFTWNDDHPPHHPGLGQQLISAVYTALATSPQWPTCNLVVTYDEHGGFFDHVAPGLVADDRAADGFDQLGFRVPTMVIGPYAKPGYVSSVTYDHTSALKHLQRTFGTAPLTARSEAAVDLTDCLDLDRLAAGEPAPPIELPAVVLDESMIGPECGGNSLKPGGGARPWVAALAERLTRRDPRLVARDGREQIFGIAEYLERHGRGGIRRGR